MRLLVLQMKLPAQTPPLSRRWQGYFYGESIMSSSLEDRVKELEQEVEALHSFIMHIFYQVNKNKKEIQNLKQG